MPILRTPARAVFVDYVCDECGKGRYLVDHKAPVAMSYPAQYAHACDKCGHRRSFTTQYPTIDFERETISLAING